MVPGRLMKEAAPLWAASMMRRFVSGSQALVGAGGFGVLGVELGDLDLFGEAGFFEEPDAVVVDIELVPGEAVAGADRVGVVVVVPAFAAGEQSDPPAVARIVLGFKAARSPKVRGGVDKPRGMQAEGGAEEGSPQEHADRADDAVPAGRYSRADGNLEDAADCEREPMEAAEPDLALVAGEVGGVAAQEGGFRVQGAAGEDPAGMRPPRAIMRGVRVAFVVGVLMMDAVRGDPEDGTALKRHGAAGAEEVFEPLGDAVAAVREQAVVAHADAHVDGEEVHDDAGGEVLPAEEEQGGDGANVEHAHEDAGDPVDAALLVFAAHAEILFDLFLGELGGGRSGVQALRCGGIKCGEGWF